MNICSIRVRTVTISEIPTKPRFFQEHPVISQSLHQAGPRIGGDELVAAATGTFALCPARALISQDVKEKNSREKLQRETREMKGKG